ncbi:hypothetical protein S40285_01108 [Stachybotrys chlorohalonatus IBT 40285]|uniref:Amidohydrolase-related domain-containing protein n=1 Tax=Stachybotrys chlorohalonatus (strain IBT 40285) TaxID=1283841 RepID=A0A084QKH3_STAC4|nr:hypothetical protein S40285_01108 [Stachybotrys chlorohalonata IBT 40285]
MHVVDPDRYPLDPAAVYRPRAHSLYDALSFESSVCLDNVVIVQPSIYGHDNSCLLNALRKLGSRRARGVVSFDPATTSAVQLRQWHAMGVRGARLNLKSSDTAMDPAQLESILTQYADAVRPLGWVVQVYVPMSLVDVLEMIVPRLGVRFCIDHLGHPCFDKASSRDPYQLRGFPALVRLLQAGQTFVKLSAPYRTSVADNHNDIEPVTRELLRLAGKSRLVFGTDWPHTRFEGLDIRPWMETVLDWCGDDEYLIQRLFKNNAEELWGVEA